MIKSHHNVGGLPEHMKLKLRRAAARAVQGRGAPARPRARPAARDGVPASVPGPGPRRAHPRRSHQAVRRPAAQGRRDLHRRAATRTASTTRSSQAFAVFLPVRSVGVMGDGRRYEYVIALRAVETIDFMTARWAQLPYEFLDLVLAPDHQRSRRASRAWSTTSRASRRRRSSGSERRRRVDSASGRAGPSGRRIAVERPARARPVSNMTSPRRTRLRGGGVCFSRPP